MCIHIVDNPTFEYDWLYTVYIIYIYTPLHPHEVSQYSVFRKWEYPKMNGLQWKILVKWIIRGYLHFRKPANRES